MKPEEQSMRRQQLYSMLGELPLRNYKVSSTMINERDCGSFILQELTLDLNGVEPVPAYVALPKRLKERNPAILYNHSHGGIYSIGKEELTIGKPYLVKPYYAEVLTSLGYIVLSIDAWNFGERRGRTESELFKEMLWKGKVLWGMMVYDSIKALDYLISRDDVEPSRIGTLGMSMGSNMAQWVGALDERVKLVVDICCLTDYHALIDSRELDGHGIYYYVPSLLKHFTAAEINALIAPRPHLSVAGILDKLTPEKGLDKIDHELKRVYAQMGAEHAWKLLKYPVEHVETAAMRKEIINFLNDEM